MKGAHLTLMHNFNEFLLIEEEETTEVFVISPWGKFLAHPKFGNLLTIAQLSMNHHSKASCFTDRPAQERVDCPFSSSDYSSGTSGNRIS